MRTALELRPSLTELRTPAAEDALVLRALAIDTFCETFGHLYPEADLQQYLATAYSLPRIEEELGDPQSLHLIAYCDGEAVGFIRARDSRLPLPPLRSPQMELQRLYVRRPWQGYGIGKTLMDAGIGAMHARGAQEICLGVWENNARAMAFYKRYGFEIAGEYDFHVGSRRDREFILRRVV